jgi:2-keto-3-deoxy-L-rhamnonate aldolase RhmA/quercetin dioxygenase-like cupin family protein
MKTRALQALRRRLAAGESVIGLWVTLDAASVTEMAVALGLDWVVIDAEHGQLDWSQILEHLRATVRSDTVALVRIATRDTVLAKRALDLGADGVVVPMIETAEQLAEALRDCRYPPEGRRGIGGERATVWGQALAEHAAEANDHVLVVPLIESVRAAAEVPRMAEVPGADVFFFGPADFSATAGHRGQWEGPGVAEQILALKDVLRAAGKACGVMTCSPEDLETRRHHGFQMLGLGSDAGLLFRGTREMLRAAGRDRQPAASLDPRDATVARPVLAAPPDRMRPDRREVVTRHGAGVTVTLQPGVVFEALVGQFNAARSLTTGIVTFAPQAVLDQHAHPASEAITVLDGELEVSVEGRTYLLARLDTIAIPRWAPHAARNPDAARPARLHVALASGAPERELVPRAFPRVEMPADSTGSPGMERVTRIHTAQRSFAVGPGSEFVDSFSAALMPGLEMSGGYGRFQPGGRLPAHVHDFDESICIVTGAATCVVEGRRHAVEGCATAMVPRGRVHYFVNESHAPMEMIWVYAGPLPERIVVDERCGTVEGDPWRASA